MCKGRKYRVLSWVLTVVMLFGMVVTPVSATSTTDTDAAIVEQTDGSTDESGDLTVSSEDESQTEEDASQNEGDLSQLGVDVNQSEDEANGVELTEESSEALSAVDELQAQIDALPSVDQVSTMDTESQNEVYAQASAIWDIYYELTEDEQAEVDTSALEQLADYFNGLVSTTATIPTSGELSSGTYTLTANVTLTGALTVASGATVIIDLNGYTISYEDAVLNTSVYMISNLGSLTITDSSEEQSGMLLMQATKTSTSTNSSNYAAGVINNAGKLYLYGGTLKTTSVYKQARSVTIVSGGTDVVVDGADIIVESSSSRQPSYGIYAGCATADVSVISGSISVSCTNSSNDKGGVHGLYGLTAGCSVNISGGTICVSGYPSASTSGYANGLYGFTTTDVSGGVITVENKSSVSSANAYGVRNNSSSTANITGGTITVTSTGGTAWGTGYANISGGEVKATKLLSTSSVSGGYYNFDPTDYLAEGYQAIALTVENDQPYYNEGYTYRVGVQAETFTVYYNTTTSYTIEYVDGESYDLTQPYSDELGYGVSDGCLYAGLYIDREHTEAIDGTTALGNGLEFYPEAGEIYYVKEISDHYLQVKCLYAWTDADGIVNLWPVTGIDDDSYSEIGFIIDDDSTYTTGTIGETGTKLTDTSTVAAETEIYESLDVEYPNAEKGYESVHTTCMELYQVSGYLAVTQELDDLLSEYNDDDEITMQAYYVTQDGVMVTGAYSRTITFKDNFSDFEVEDTNVGSETSYPTDSGSAVMLLSLAVSSSCVLMASVPEETTYTVTKYDDGVIYTQEVSEDDTDVEITYAGKEGYLFGGWFEDEACTVAADFSNIDSDMTVYAKYVSDDYMQVKIVVQSTRGVVKTLRFISAVDCKNYAEVGFEYEYNGTQESVEVTKYSTTASGYTAVKLFGGDVITGSKLIYNDFSVSKISAGTEITITPYWVTMDGTKVYGTSRTVTFTGTTVE